MLMQPEYEKQIIHLGTFYELRELISNIVWYVDAGKRRLLTKVSKFGDVHLNTLLPFAILICYSHLLFLLSFMGQRGALKE